MELTQLHWYDDEGIFRILKWNDKTKEIIEDEEVKPERLIPIGDGHSLESGGRTLDEVLDTMYKAELENNPTVLIYKTINAYSFGGLLPVHTSEVLEGQIVVNFYHLND